MQDRMLTARLFALALAAGALAAPDAYAQQPSSYTGPGSCAAAICHGSIRPIAGSRILQTEYSTWLVQDKHAKATDVLTSPVSGRMAKILGLPRADTAPKCLACHGLNAPEASRARTFAEEGVSCEACHGPASAWLGPHTVRGWTHAQSIQLGMYDTKDPVKRTERCASCHVGTADAFVDHAMIAAGHPDLVFDLETFSAAMPRHWQEPPPDERVRTWAIGQLVQLRESLDRLGRRAASASWPEYAELDCFACHHNLTRPEDSWRQDRGYPDRQPGTAPWNQSRLDIGRLVVRAFDATEGDRFDTATARLAADVAKTPLDRAQVAQTTKELAAIVESSIARARTAPVDAALTTRLLRAILENGERIAAHGERSAEQAAMSLDTLMAAHTVDRQASRPALDRVFQQLENPSAYDPRKFVAELRRIGELVK